jgi:deoxyhypusine synthase
VVPGWEDSTLGNIFAAHCIEEHIKNVHTVRTGIEYMMMLSEWYTKTAKPMKLLSTVDATVKGATAGRKRKAGAGMEHSESAVATAETNGDQANEVGSIGFFQIGGGIAGDFPICVVPMLHQDLRRESVPLWGYYCQISDAPTSYGGYSGAIPNEKITWGKLAINTPKFVIESDASIVAPLIFAHVLGM